MKTFVITKIQKKDTNFDLHVIRMQNSFLSIKSDEWTNLHDIGDPALYSTYDSAINRVMEWEVNKQNDPRNFLYRNKQVRGVEVEIEEPLIPNLAECGDLIDLLY